MIYQDGFIASDGWFIDKKEAYFVGMITGALFKVDFVQNVCEKVCDPIKKNILKREYGKCIKYDDKLIVIPYIGKDIGFYHFMNDSINFLEIECNTELWCLNARLIGDNLFVFSKGTQEIVVIDVREERIKKRSRIPCGDTDVGFVYDDDKRFLMIERKKNLLLEYSFESEEFNELKEIKSTDRLHCMVSDGDKLWIFGNMRSFVLYDFENEEYLDLFPKDYGIYVSDSNMIDYSFDDNKNPIIHDCIYLNGIIWCIPFQTNLILGISKDMRRIIRFDDEQETSMTMYNRSLNHRYLVEYVRESRYIGLYSLREDCLYEIDTVDLRMYKKNIDITNGAILTYNDHLFMENDVDRSIFWKQVLI